MRQPKAILPIFFAEMWERFGYYVILGLLILYLIYKLDFSQSQSIITLSEFVSWIYIAPLFGGLIADRILGYRYAVVCGSILLCIGYLLLGLGHDAFLHLSLSIIIVGNGLMKPNNASLLGKFYYLDDPRRYAGYTFFYIGINVGGLLAILLASYAGVYFGFHFAFTVAGIGMIIATLYFIFGFRYFENRGLPIIPDNIKPKFLRLFANRFYLVTFLLITILSLHFLLHETHLSELLLIIVAAAVLISLFYIQHSYNQTTRHKLIAVIILTAAAVIFWAEQLQIFISIMLYSIHLVDRKIFNVTIPASLFLLLEPLFILLIGLFFAKLWRAQSEQHKKFTPPIKFALGLLFVGIAMAVLAASTYLAPHMSHVSPIWLVIFYLFLTVGELLITPTGLAMISELAPARMTGFMMGVWYMAIGLGGLLSGFLARLIINAHYVKLHHHYLGPYSRTFTICATLALLTGIGLLLITPQLNKLIESQS